MLPSRLTCAQELQAAPGLLALVIWGVCSPLHGAVGPADMQSLTSMVDTQLGVILHRVGLEAPARAASRCTQPADHAVSNSAHPERPASVYLLLPVLHCASKDRAVTLAVTMIPCCACFHEEHKNAFTTTEKYTHQHRVSALPFGRPAPAQYLRSAVTRPAQCLFPLLNVDSCSVSV
jgi:hypothetical protein